MTINIKRHEATTLAGRQTKIFASDFSFANSCRQMTIFCAKFIISSHFATMAIGSANPECFFVSRTNFDKVNINLTYSSLPPSIFQLSINVGHLSLLKWELLIKERICSVREFFPFRAVPYGMEYHFSCFQAGLSPYFSLLFWFAPTFPYFFTKMPYYPYFLTLSIMPGIFPCSLR